MKFTVLGGRGYIGARLVAHLQSRGHEVSAPLEEQEWLSGRNLGHVIYAIGLTGDFRARLHDTIEAHVNVLARVLQKAVFDSLLYLSSTRVYGGLPKGTLAHEDMQLNVTPSADAIFDLSKLLGESLCLSTNLPRVRIARLSNVYGANQDPQTFLGSIFRDLAKDGKVTILESPDSSKDYIALDDVVKLLELISLNGIASIYNVASGISVTHRGLSRRFEDLGHAADFAPNGATRSFPRIDNSRVVDEFHFTSRSLLDDLPVLVESYKA